MRNINIRNIKLTKASYRQLKKVPYWLYGSVADSIECGNWHVPSDTIEYIDIKHNLENEFKEFYNLTDEIVKIKSFESDILSFHKGH